MVRMQDAEVVVVGAGPVGLAAAAGLARLGCSVLVREARLEVSEPAHHGVMGARSIHSSSARLLEWLGVFDRVRSRALWWFEPRPRAARAAGRAMIEGFVG